MSEIEGSTSCRPPNPPADPLAPHFAVPNHVLGIRAGPTQPGRSAFLRYDFAVRSESIGCVKHSLPLPFGRSPLPLYATEHTKFRKLVSSARRREKGAPRR